MLKLCKYLSPPCSVASNTSCRRCRPAAASCSVFFLFLQPWRKVDNGTKVDAKLTTAWWRTGVGPPFSNKWACAALAEEEEIQVLAVGQLVWYWYAAQSVAFILKELPTSNRGRALFACKLTRLPPPLVARSFLGHWSGRFTRPAGCRPKQLCTALNK